MQYIIVSNESHLKWRQVWFDKFWFLHSWKCSCYSEIIYKPTFFLCFHIPAFIHIFQHPFSPSSLQIATTSCSSSLSKTNKKTPYIQLSTIFQLTSLTPTLLYASQSHYFTLFCTELNYLLFLHIVHTKYSRFGK